MQLDMKIKGLSMNVFKEGFTQAGEAVDYILEEMLKVQPNVAEKLSPYAPLIMNLTIPEKKIAMIIGK